MTPKRHQETREYSSAATPAEQALVHAQSGREVVQEFMPLAESLEWELGG